MSKKDLSFPHPGRTGSLHRIITSIALSILFLATLMSSLTALQPSPAGGETTRTGIDFYVTEIPDSVRGGFEPHVIAGPGVDGKEWFYIDSPTGLGSQKSGNLWISRDKGLTWEFKPKDPVGNFGESGDSYTAINKDGIIYYTDLYLSTASMETSLDGGDTWLQNPVASEYVLDDRQWLVIGPTVGLPVPGATGETIYFAFNQIPAGLVMVRSQISGTGMEWVPCNGGVPITFNGGYRDYFDVDRNDGTIYCPNGEGSDIYVYVSGDGGDTFQRKLVEGADKGQNIFISVAVGNDGSVYLCWSTQADIWMAVSQDHADTWKVHKVTQDKGTRVLPWITAGDDGRIGMVWYGTRTEGNSNNADQMAGAMWDLEGAICTNALDDEPDFLITAIEKDVHGGTISTGGLGGGADRDIGDFFTCDIDESGRMITSYGKDGDDGPNTRRAVVMFARQVGGPYLLEDAGPVANFTAKDDELKVKVDASPSHVPGGGSIVEYRWKWGDGTITNSTDPITTHGYGKEGEYRIILTVVDDEGMTDSAAVNVRVSAAAESFFEEIEGPAFYGGIGLTLILMAMALAIAVKGRKKKEKKTAKEDIITGTGTGRGAGGAEGIVKEGVTDAQVLPIAENGEAEYVPEALPADDDEADAHGSGPRDDAISR